MIVIAGLILGGLWGAYQARARKGTGFDIAQYAAGYGICFALIGMFLTITITRLL